MSAFSVRDLGLLAYDEATEYQKALLEEVADGHAPDTLLLVEHPPVLTLGANFHPENLLLPVEAYAERGIQVVQTERGGDITFHGPGQLVMYPIFDVAKRGKDLHVWLRDLEETMISSVAEFGLAGVRFAPNTGCWVGGNKIAAIGIKIRRWVSMHGIALNCNNDLGAFGLIIPCGIRGHGVTSLSQELGRAVTVDVAKPVVLRAFDAITRPTPL